MSDSGCQSKRAERPASTRVSRGIEALQPSVVSEVYRLVEAAAARLMNSDYTRPQTPEKARFVETMGMLWDALSLLRPDQCHPEDEARARDRIDELLAAEAVRPRGEENASGALEVTPQNPRRTP